MYSDFTNKGDLGFYFWLFFLTNNVLCVDLKIFSRGGMSNGYLSLPGGPRNIMVILQYKEKWILQGGGGVSRHPLLEPRMCLIIHVHVLVILSNGELHVNKMLCLRENWVSTPDDVSWHTIFDTHNSN